MGKRKKKGKRYKYSEQEFIANVCRTCELCVAGEPELCYHGAYITDPKKFMQTTIYRLYDCRDVMLGLGYSDTSEQCTEEDFMHILETAFCETNSCHQKPSNGKKCDNIVGCMFALRGQMRPKKLPLIPSMVGYSKKQLSKKQLKKLNKRERKAAAKRANRKIQKQKVDPYPTFFCNVEFSGEVDKILNEYNDRKSNQTEEHTGPCADCPFKPTDDTEP